jgi:hypothetical protein
VADTALAFSIGAILMVLAGLVAIFLGQAGRDRDHENAAAEGG